VVPHERSATLAGVPVFRSLGQPLRVVEDRVGALLGGVLLAEGDAEGEAEAEGLADAPGPESEAATTGPSAQIAVGLAVVAQAAPVRTSRHTPGKASNHRRVGLNIIVLLHGGSRV
jgi:hypothetical protein